MMPLGQYNIGDYVKDLLKQIEYSDDHELDSEALEKVVGHTIGGNPRSLKRLVNSLSLIEQFSSSRNQKFLNENVLLGDLKVRNLLLFSLVCLQIAYPDIYDLLVVRPDFESWDDNWAHDVTQQNE